MDKEWISVIDAASQLGLPHKQTLFKIIKRLSISTVKQRNSGSRNQLISYITQCDLELIRQHLSESKPQTKGSEASAEPQIDQGVFYLIQLEPKHDPGRFKVGFASNLSERLRTHRCSAPMALVLATWPCRPLWEKTAIDCVAQSCEQIHTEVFRTDDIAEVKNRCTQFFALMPKIENRREPNQAFEFTARNELKISGTE
jgi:hypothetical protein